MNIEDKIKRLEKMVLTLSHAVIRLNELSDPSHYDSNLRDVNRTLDNEVTEFDAYYESDLK